MFLRTNKRHHRHQRSAQPATHFPPREQLCNRSCSNKHTLCGRRHTSGGGAKGEAWARCGWQREGAGRSSGASALSAAGSGLTATRRGSRPTMRWSTGRRAAGGGKGEAEAAGERIQRERRKCEHNRKKSKCKDCGGASICENNCIRSQCKDCRGARICQHSRRRIRCKDYGGASICQHNRRT